MSRRSRRMPSIKSTRAAANEARLQTSKTPRDTFLRPGPMIARAARKLKQMERMTYGRGLYRP